MRIITFFIAIFIFSNPAFTQQQSNKQLPIGVFDSGTGGLTILQAMLTLDAFNNKTGMPGSDGIPDFSNEAFQYLADQANMPYGNYAAVNKTILLKEHILKNMQFFLQNQYETHNKDQWQPHSKPMVKMVVIACNTATAYAISDIKDFVAAKQQQIPVIGVIDAGVKAALEYHTKYTNGAIGVFATAGTVASDGYPKAIRALAAKAGIQQPVIVSQGGAGLAESIDRDFSYFSDTVTAMRSTYKGPAVNNTQYPIDTLLMNVYRFNKAGNKIICEFDSTGRCLDIQLNDPSNYVRYHLVSLLEKMKRENYSLPLNTLILGCTHYPYLKDTIQSVLKELYNYQSGNEFVYRKYLAAHVELVDPGVETAKEAYIALRKQQMNLLKPNPIKNDFFISVPNTSLNEVELQPDGWFTYAYKYGRTENANKEYVKYVPFDTTNIVPATYSRFKQALPDVYIRLHQVVKGL
jgi:glutamate racemase